MYICMSVCLYVCIYVCMIVLMYECMIVCMYVLYCIVLYCIVLYCIVLYCMVCMYVCMHACMHTGFFVVGVRMCMCMHIILMIHAGLDGWRCMHVYMYVYATSLDFRARPALQPEPSTLVQLLWLQTVRISRKLGLMVVSCPSGRCRHGF